MSPLIRPRPDDPTDPPPLRALAEVLHRSCGAEGAATFAYVTHEPPGSVAFGLWPVPPQVPHPADPLIGFVAPQRWSAVGLVTTGLLRSLDDPTVAPEPVVVTVLVDRSGEVASIIEDGGAAVQVLDEPPFGWAADALARVLGRPTPPPVETPAQWVEATWLDRLAAGVLPHPERGRDWRWLADRHPLVGSGPTPTPADLARRTAAHGRAHRWSDLRSQSAATTEVVLGPDPVHPPPPGLVVPAPTWFDDGAYARWLLRQLPPPEALLPDLLAVLPPERGQDLLDALVAEPADPPP